MERLDETRDIKNALNAPRKKPELEIAFCDNTYTVLILIEVLSVASAVAHITEHGWVKSVEEPSPGIHPDRQNTDQKHPTNLHQTRSHCVCL